MIKKIFFRKIFNFFFSRISDCFVKINHNEFSFTDKSKQKNRGTVDVWWLYDDGGKYSSAT